MRATWLLAIPLSLGLAAGAASPSRADTVVPVEWGGIWQSLDNTYDCGTNALLFSGAQQDTLCPGTTLPGPPPGEMTLDCTTTADGDSYEVHCTANLELAPGCTVAFAYDTTVTRTGDTYTSVSTSSTTYTGECFGLADTCERTESTGTRIAGPSPACDGAADERRAWGAVKLIYR